VALIDIVFCYSQNKQLYELQQSFFAVNYKTKEWNENSTILVHMYKYTITDEIISFCYQLRELLQQKHTAKYTILNVSPTAPHWLAPLIINL